MYRLDLGRKKNQKKKKPLHFLWPPLSSNLGRMINSAQQRENRKKEIKNAKNEESIKEDGSFVMICMKQFFYVLFFIREKMLFYNRSYQLQL